MKKSNRVVDDYMKHHPAAFINAIAEEGTKAEAIKYLQETWNELCDLKEILTEIYISAGTYAEGPSEPEFSQFLRLEALARKGLNKATQDNIG